MDGRRGGRQTLLPLRRNRQLSNSVSCWYCDIKFMAFNDPLFRFGRRHSRYLRAWFSIGIGFSLAALFGVTVILLCELARATLVYTGNARSGNSLFGFPFMLNGMNISLSSLAYLCLSSVVCVIVHEFGHALAAASEGVQMEYVAFFLALLFPGALVAFNDALLQALPKVASLRIYCAGIWHNAVFCGVCSLALFLLPFILSPLYRHGDSPMVFSTCILCHHYQTSGQSSGIAYLRKSYCVPHSLIEESKHTQFDGHQTYCPDELVAFAPIPCLNVSGYYDGGNKTYLQKRGIIPCLNAKDVVKFRKCAYNSVQAPKNDSGCLCSEEELCLSPLQLPTLGWVEITFSRLNCLDLGSSFSDDKHSRSTDKSCLQTFVFVGDLISMAHSIHLTSYQPRLSMYFIACLPNQLEKLFTCAFHVSMVLALLNSLPVFFLDGESILEVTLLHYVGLLSTKMRRSLLRCCLVVGTFISSCYILQMIFSSVKLM